MNDNAKSKISRSQILKDGALAGAGLLLSCSNIIARAAAKVHGKGLHLPQGPAHLHANPLYKGPLPASVAELSAAGGNANLFYAAPLIDSISFATPKSQVGGHNYHEMEMKEGSLKMAASAPTFEERFLKR